MKIATLFAAGLVTVAVAPSLASAQNVVAQMGTTDQGEALVNGEGFSLYTFDNDALAVSNCNGDCAVKWPPLEASNRARAAGDFGILIRADGARQWAYQGQPLYTWINDTEARQTTGDGVKGVWHLWRPSGAVRSWLFKMMLNIHRDQLRSPHARARFEAVEDAGLAAHNEQTGRTALRATARHMARLPSGATAGFTVDCG